MIRFDTTIASSMIGIGKTRLNEADYIGRTFTELQLCPNEGESVEVEDVSFTNCNVDPGTCVVGPNVVLRSVSFVNFRCGDSLRISSDTVFDRVRIEGEYPGILMIQPDKSRPLPLHEYPVEGFGIDISSYFGDAVIIGVPGARVKRDLSRHVVVRREHCEQIASESANLSRLSFWKICSKKIRSFGCDEGIFTLPSESNKKFEIVQAERTRLETLGADFS